jgi:hypothetical protein
MERYSLTSDSSGLASIISPGESWDKYMHKLSVFGLDDVYFDHRYVTLYIEDGSDALAEAFIFEFDNDVFFFPYIRKPIPDLAGLWDFETAYGYSGPIATTVNRVFLESAWNAFKCLAQEAGIITGLIRFHPLLANERFIVDGPVNIFYECDTVWMDCRRDLSNVVADYPKKNLSRLRSMEREGVVAQPCRDKGALNTFGELYIERMKSLEARSEYHFSKSYFDQIAELGSDHWIIYFAYTPDKVVMGGCLLLFSKRFCHYHLSASLKEFFKYSPNDVLRHTVIRDMLDSGLEAIHFGGGRTSDPGDSLLAFKLKFSKQVSRFKVGACIIDERAYQSVCKKWEAMYPEKIQDFGGYLLKYRY